MVGVGPIDRGVPSRPTCPCRPPRRWRRLPVRPRPHRCEIPFLRSILWTRSGRCKSRRPGETRCRSTPPPLAILPVRLIGETPVDSRSVPPIHCTCCRKYRFRRVLDRRRDRPWARVRLRTIGSPHSHNTRMRHHRLLWEGEQQRRQERPSGHRRVPTTSRKSNGNGRSMPTCSNKSWRTYDNKRKWYGGCKGIKVAIQIPTPRHRPICRGINHQTYPMPAVSLL